MKKIAFDTLPLSSGHSARGMGVYTRRLLENLEKQISKEMKLKIDAFSFSENESKLNNYDLLHYPYFDLFYHTLPLRRGVETVVTVPDVTPLIYPKYYPPGIKGTINFRLQKQALKSVESIITITETSKKDIVRFLDIPADRVFPTHLAPNFSFKKQNRSTIKKVKDKFDLPDKFVLYIGDVNWNKNLIRLIKAVKKAKLKLVIVGKSAINENFDKGHIENKPLLTLQNMYGNDKDILRLGFVEDSELNAIWQMTTLYCMASLYEGFGLSVVEAMDAGVPVVCSRTQALVEVAGDAAVYFDPFDVDDIADKLLETFNSKSIQRELVAKGNIRVKKYSWEKTAKETIKVYKQTLRI